MKKAAWRKTIIPLEHIYCSASGLGAKLEERTIQAGHAARTTISLGCSASVRLFPLPISLSLPLPPPLAVGDGARARSAGIPVERRRVTLLLVPACPLLSCARHRPRRSVRPVLGSTSSSARRTRLNSPQFLGVAGWKQPWMSGFARPSCGGARPRPGSVSSPRSRSTSRPRWSPSPSWCLSQVLYRTQSASCPALSAESWNVLLLASSGGVGLKHVGGFSSEAIL